MIPWNSKWLTKRQKINFYLNLNKNTGRKERLSDRCSKSDEKGVLGDYFYQLQDIFCGPAYRSVS